MAIDRAGLAAFLRSRREAVRPEDVGLPRGPRRRTSGLRREEVAALCAMSADYYARLEQERGPHPSPEMIAAIAQGLRLTLDERDHLFRLAGHAPPARGLLGEHVGPGLSRILDRLHDTPAEVITELGETLRQTPLGVALTGDATRFSGPARSLGFRWFTDPSCRELYDPADHAYLSRVFVSALRESVTRRGPRSRGAHYAELLLERSDEFRTVWERQEIGLRPKEVKRYVHPSLGPIELQCQTLLDPDRSHVLLVYTAIPGTESHEKLRLLSVIGDQVAPAP